MRRWVVDATDSCGYARVFRVDVDILEFQWNFRVHRYTTSPGNMAHMNRCNPYTRLSALLIGVPFVNPRYYSLT